MQDIEYDFEEASKEGVLPGIILGAANRDGSLNYIKAFGKVSREEGAAPTSTDSTFVLASATKLVTCVAAMQCVEKGLVALDDDISKYLPEWKEPMILTGFNEENGRKPILERARSSITLRHLLSHTSGITGLEDEHIMEYYNSLGNSRGSLIMRYFRSDDPEVKAKALGEIRGSMDILVVEPLIFEPGTKWAYGMSIDWAGQIVERVTNLRLEAYCQKHIFAPLSMSSTTFRLLHHPHIASRLLSMHTRSATGQVQTAESIYPLDPKIDMGGISLYTSTPDFMALLTSLMRNDERVLKPETVDEMFAYRLPEGEEFEKSKSDEEEIRDSFGEMAGVGLRLDHCLAGRVVLGDLVGGRKKGSVNWMGATSCFWWIDRKAGICGFYGSQVMMAGDQKVSAGFFRRFERAVYAAHGKETRKSG